MDEGVTDADRIAADGVTITLEDGKEYTVKYDFRALRRIERRFVTLARFQEAIRPDGAVFEGLSAALACGIKGMDEDKIVDLLSPPKLAEYDKAVEDALNEAFPTQPSGKEESQNQDLNQDQSPSTGPISPGSAASDSTEPLMSSGV